MTATVLVVDDEEAISELICDALALAGFRTLHAAHGLAALRTLRDAAVDLVVLDINLPGMDGYDVLERMRASGDTTPVVVLTARQDRQDTKRGFELGADDFVRKPFGIEELTLRVAAVLRRTTGSDGARALTVGHVRLDEDAHRVTVDDRVVELSRTEFRLLSVLMRSVDRVLTKEQLLDQVWGLTDTRETTVVETYVSYLRRKLGDAISVRTVRGVGYQLVSGSR